MEACQACALRTIARVLCHVRHGHSSHPDRPTRKARVEKILDQLGMTSTQAVNMFFAQIERRKAIPFPVAIDDNRDVAPPIEHVAKVWDDLDQTDFSQEFSRCGVLRRSAGCRALALLTDSSVGAGPVG